MKKLLPLIAAFAVLFLITACEKNVKDQRPTEVVQKETIQKDDSKKKKVVRPYYHKIRHYYKASTKHSSH